MRNSMNEVVNETIKNGFNYYLQVWVKDFIILDCGHRFGCGCEARRYAGCDIREMWLGKEGDL